MDEKVKSKLFFDTHLDMTQSSHLSIQRKTKCQHWIFWVDQMQRKQFDLQSEQLLLEDRVLFESCFGLGIPIQQLWHSDPLNFRPVYLECWNKFCWYRKWNWLSLLKLRWQYHFHIFHFLSPSEDAKSFQKLYLKSQISRHWWIWSHNILDQVVDGFSSFESNALPTKHVCGKL